MRKEKRTPEGWAKKRQITADWFKNISIEKSLLYSARNRAKKKGLECSITEEDIVVPNVCPILGIKLEKVGGRQHGSSPSLDRVDNTLGYVKGNIRVISYKANSCKNSLTPQQIQRLYHYVFGLADI